MCGSACIKELPLFTGYLSWFRVTKAATEIEHQVFSISLTLVGILFLLFLIQFYFQTEGLTFKTCIRVNDGPLMLNITFVILYHRVAKRWLC